MGKAVFRVCFAYIMCGSVIYIVKDFLMGHLPSRGQVVRQALWAFEHLMFMLVMHSTNEHVFTAAHQEQTSRLWDKV
jgi:hypothetical protein